jgi:hypothetical protein
MQAHREPDIEVVQRRVREFFDAFRAIAATRFRNEIGNVIESVGTRFVRAALGQAGYFVRGPGVLMPPGRWRARFWVEADLAGEDDRRGRDTYGSVAATIGDGRR